MMESAHNGRNGNGKTALISDSVLQMYRSSTVLLEMVKQSLTNRKYVLREACNEFILFSLGSDAKMATASSPSLDPEQSKITPVMANTILERFHKIVLEQAEGGDNNSGGGLN
jgi:hypothetical protein